MSVSDFVAVMNDLEADNCAALYDARWNEAAAADVIPKLSSVLDSDDRDILLRALRALVIVGPKASDVAPKIIRLLHSSELWVFQAAAIALARVSLNKPESAVSPLIDAATVPGGEKHVMFALIDLGHAAKAASPVFVRALASRSASVRRLALRGLVSIGADEELLTKALEKAASDKSKEVREYAAKVTGRATPPSKRRT